MNALRKEFLEKLGVIEYGYTEESIPKSINHFLTWVNNRSHGVLSYLADHRKELRTDIKKVYPDFQSALVFLFDYSGARKNQDTKIASYAFAFSGNDYHDVIHQRLNEIALELQKQIGSFEFKISLDIHPVLERDLAYRAGLGWFGKNSMLINRKWGSFFLIGSILINQKLSLETKSIETDHCGHCQACVDSCPTHAIDPATRTLRANQCISTYTIELFKEAEPPLGFDKSRGEIFGCDICQDVCPWNTKPLERAIPVARGRLGDFFSRPIRLIKEDIEKMSLNDFKKFFKGTVFFRTGKKGLLKNFKPTDINGDK